MRILIAALIYCLEILSYADNADVENQAALSSSTQVAISPDMQQLAFSNNFFDNSQYNNLTKRKNQKIEFPTIGKNNDRCK